MCISLHTYINNLIIHKQLKPCICQKDPNASFQLQSLLATLNSMKWVSTSDHSHEKKHGKGITGFPDCQVLMEINWTHLHGWDLNPSHIIAFSTLSERMVELLLSAGASCTVRPFSANLIKWPQNQWQLGSAETCNANTWGIDITCNARGGFPR